MRELSTDCRSLEQKGTPWNVTLTYILTKDLCHGPFASGITKSWVSILTMVFPLPWSCLFQWLSATIAGIFEQSVKILAYNMLLREGRKVD